MKTAQEIQAEVPRLMALGRQYRDELREANGSAVAVPSPRVLLRLQESPRTTQQDAQPESLSIFPRHHERAIEAAMERDVLVYRLVDQDPEIAPSGRTVQEDAPEIVMSSQSAFEVLHAGYELVEEERLAALLEPYAGRNEDHDGPEPVSGEAASEVEAIVETDLLSPAGRLRTRAEIAEFLGGRLEANAFIPRIISRHRARECHRETLAERHEIKLTIDEP
jgi:hypothetical protein